MMPGCCDAGGGRRRRRGEKKRGGRTEGIDEGMWRSWWEMETRREDKREAGKRELEAGVENDVGDAPSWMEGEDGDEEEKKNGERKEEWIERR